jgi:cell pole-organizing protein PopZ
MCGCVEYVERDIRDLNVNDFLANVRVNGAGEAILEALKQIGVNLRDTVKVTPKKAFDDMVRGMVRGMVRDEIENIRNTPFVDCTDPRFFVP